MPSTPAVKKVGSLEFAPPSPIAYGRHAASPKRVAGNFCLPRRISPRQLWPTYFQTTLFRLGGKRAGSQPLRTAARHLPMRLVILAGERIMESPKNKKHPVVGGGIENR